MNEYNHILKSTGLFKGLELVELDAVLSCMGAQVKSVGKGEVVLLAGRKPEYVGVVLSGQLHIVREDRDGNRRIIAAVTSGGMFAEAMCCAGVSESPVTVAAEADSTVMLLKFSRIPGTCSKACAFHTRLIGNMLSLIAEKSILMQDRMEIVSLKSVRAKVMRYLESFVPRQGRDITIPFNREGFADFLCVERSALSHELARMKQDGLIEYRKNKFTLFDSQSKGRILMDARKKELTAEYKEREIVGGVYVIRNTQTGQRFLDAATDMQASRNRFSFAQKTNTCVHKRLEADWKQYGSAAFVFEALEELTKGESQTPAEFQADVAALKELWLEKLSDEPGGTELFKA